MAERKGFDLGDYVEVKDRIKLFYELFGQGRLVTGEIRLTTEPDGVPRVLVQGLAYRDPTDTLPGVGWSWMQLPGTTSYTKGSELENTETSAWGRAIGSLGILIDRSIASSQEVQNKQEPVTTASLNAQERETVAAKTYSNQPGAFLPRARVGVTESGKAVITNGDGSLIGTVELAKDFPDFLPKQGPDGMVLAFKLVSPDGGIKVIAKGVLAEVLPTLRDTVLGQRVSCWGHVRDETFTPKGTKKSITYQVLDLERIKTPDGMLPAQLDDTGIGSHDNESDIAGVLPAPEAETAPLFEGPLFEAPS